MHSNRFCCTSRRAWTLVEIMVVVAIIALLCTGAWLGYSSYVKKAESKACLIKIANFGKGLLSYVHENQQWPQEEVIYGANGKAPDEDQLWDWWFKQLKPHQISEDDWYCPSDIALRKKEEKMEEEQGKSSSGFNPAIKSPSYIPAKFGPGPFAPYDAAGHPWAIERNGHAEGMHKVMPNGTVQTEFNFKAIKPSAVVGR